MGDKLVKVLGQETVSEMEALDAEGLKKVIVESNTAMKQVRDELESNMAYQSLKSDLKAVTAGKREVDRRQKAKIQLALQLLEAKGR